MISQKFPPSQQRAAAIITARFPGILSGKSAMMWRKDDGILGPPFAGCHPGDTKGSRGARERDG
jgi:hypothetical protein